MVAVVLGGFIYEKRLYARFRKYLEKQYPDGRMDSLFGVENK
jgi:hypothetical protein